MGVTLYEHPDYNNTTGYSIDEPDLGISIGMPCWPTWDDCPNGGWGNRVSSIKIEPGGAYEWCGWADKNQSGTWNGNPDCYTTSTPQVVHNDTYESRSIKKICDHESNIWDSGCNELSPDTTKYKGDCSKGSNCWNKQKQICTRADTNLATNLNCKNWCIENPNECLTQINNYCNSLSMNTMINDIICLNGKDDFIAKKCIDKSYFFHTPQCTTYCTKNPEACTASAQNYCQNSFNLSCQNFCKNDNIDICKSAIQKYCIGNKIKNDTYCKEILLHKQMNGGHDIEMGRYCNAEGRQINTTNINTLENPICACYDKGLISAKFKNIKDDKVKDILTGRPQCFYDQCFDSVESYKKNNEICPPITICSIDLGDVQIKDSANITIKNVCGDNSPTSSSAENTGITSNFTIDCKMEDWSECSNTCREGTQTRNKILDPINGGELCGPTSQTCKIPCPTLKEQLQNSYFNFNDLYITNKIILITVFIIIIIIYIF
jgi:hypothetical protein